MNDSQFNERDHLAWSRFMLLNIAAAGLSSAGDPGAYVDSIRARLSEAWSGLGAQGVEGAMLSMILTLESMGCEIKSTQTSPENSEIIVESLPGSVMLAGIEERFDVAIDPPAWYELLQTDAEAANRIYDILGAIADGAGVEYAREVTDDGDVRLVLRAW